MSRSKRPIVANSTGGTQYWDYRRGATKEEVWIEGTSDKEPDRRVIMVVNDRKHAEEIVARLTNVYLKD